MRSTVPSDVDEANEFAVIPGADPAQAVVERLLLPVEALDYVVVERVGVERFDFSALESAASLVRDGHDRTLTTSTRVRTVDASPGASVRQ
jgi:hypothetical protein